MALEKYDHNYDNIEQFKVNDVILNDKIMFGKIHTLKEGKLKKCIFIWNLVPQRVIDKYCNLEFSKLFYSN